MPRRIGAPTQGIQNVISGIQIRVGTIAPFGAKLQPNTVTNLKAVSNGKASAQVSFEITSLTGVDSFVLLRNFSRDPGSAKRLNLWTAKSLLRNPLTLPLTVTYSDSDQAIAGQQVYYWIEVIPQGSPVGSNIITIGPQLMNASADPGAPNAIVEFALSHQAASGGGIVVGVTIKPSPGDSRWASTVILAAGYNGIAAKVAVAQSGGTSFNFTLKQTGETPTFTAIAVSSTGKQALTGPTATLNLGAGLSLPAQVMNAYALELGRGLGVQISWPQGPEPSLIQYLIYRGPKTGGFGAAAQIGTMAWSAQTALYNFTDANGLLGSFEWYVLAQNATGNSASGDAVQVNALNSTADLTLNNAASTPTTQPLTAVTGVPVNAATINVAAFQVQYPFGLVSYSSGSITPLNDATLYYVFCADPNYKGGAQVYFATTDGTQVTAQEAYLFLGTVTTPVHGGGGTGGSGGGSGPCFTGNTLIETSEGMRRIAEIHVGDSVRTLAGFRRVLNVLDHFYEGPMQDMSMGEYVTPTHLIYDEYRLWVDAKEIWLEEIAFSGHVFNLHCEGKDDLEHNYRLACGRYAHNLRK